MSVETHNWAVEYHDKVVGWLRPYAKLYAKHGHTIDDLAQEARLVIHTRREYLDEKYVAALKNTGLLVGWSASQAKMQFDTLVRTIVLRQVKRLLLGRRTVDPPKFTDDGWEEINKAEAREHDAHIQLELAEMIDASPIGPVRAFLRTLFEGRSDEQMETAVKCRNGTDALMLEVQKEAGKFVLAWFATEHHWRHES